MLDSRCSDNDVSKRDIPSFIEPRPPLISNPFMRPKPQKGTNLLDLFEEDSECEEPELVQVYLRLKPCNTPSNLYEIRSDRCLITSLDTTTAGHGRRTQHNVSKMYTFSHIFGTEASQREIFETVVKDNLKKLPEGHSFTLLTYGASGSGKTFTLMGTVASPGLVPRSLEYVFKVVDAAQQPLYKPAEAGADVLNAAEQDYELQWVKRLRHISAPLRDKYRRMSVQLHNNLTNSNLDLTNRTRHYVWVSFIEIYNEGIYDLLVPSDRRAGSKLAIREDSSGNAYVKGATQAFVRSGEEAYDVMVAGKHNLQVAATGVHAQSSRSHCIFTITMLTETDSGVRASCVRLCDLAGCERAARTLNTGTRMQESRAINSSLHVLERCLHTLRRRQLQRRRALVPYRESKLTRLLGAGLSGARGEAVSMVVTLNPAPQYAHETRHVLQLAAVARDIQVNNTISEYPSSLESSQTNDTTIAASNEVMKLRADNERLHFELIQSQARNRELAASMEEKQAAAADTMRELVEEARAISKQYYEAQVQAVRDEMEEMIEEYENRLINLTQPTGDTPLKLQNKINQLLMDIAILEEKLSAEQLARARAEEEVQHLRACIEERDEKEENNEDVISIMGSDDSEDEVDPNNESLEPTFTKEDINRSRLIRQSAAAEQNSINSEHSIVNDSVLEKSNDTLKDNYKTNYSTDVDCSFGTGEDVSEFSCKPDNTQNNDVSKVEAPVENKFTEDCVKKELSRNTYDVLHRDDVSTFFDCSRELTCDSLNLKHSTSLRKSLLEDKKSNTTNSYKVEEYSSATFVNSIINSYKKSSDNNNSLAQFERLELATKNSMNNSKQNTNLDFKSINALKEKRNYFDDDFSEHNEENKEKVEETNASNKDILQDIKVNNNLNTEIDEYRSPSIVREATTSDFEPSTIKKLLGDSFTRPGEPILTVKKNFFAKKHDSVDMFEGSPLTVKINDNEVENIRKSINKLELINSKLNEVESVKEMEQIPDEEPIKNETECENSKIATDKPVENMDKPEENLEDIQHLQEPERDTEVKEDQQKDSNVSMITDKNIAQEISSNTIRPDKDMAPVNNNESMLEVSKLKVNNTLDEFDRIYKDVTAPRATEFELLITHDESQLDKNISKHTEESEDVKYNLRHRSKTERKRNDVEFKSEDIIKPTKRNLRLRRRKNLSDEEIVDTRKEETLKDIVNLQTEFSDVLLDIPAPEKVVKDIPSPEKRDGEEENVPPVYGIQSCPSKSIQRSRRKLFTPRPEPLDESVSPSGDSNERIYVPRPSYRRPRARRKL